MTNCEHLLSDVAIALEVLELVDFYSAYVGFLEPMLNELNASQKKAAEQSIFRQARAWFRDYKVVKQKAEQSQHGSDIDDHFTMIWDDERNTLVWSPDQWSQMMLAKTTEYVESHLNEFERKPH